MLSSITFENAFSYVLSHEGTEVSENPNDLGGISKYGISLRFLKSLPPERLKLYGFFEVEAEDIKNLSIEIAKKIYKGEFWDMADFPKVCSQNIVNYMFDATINMGLAPAIKCTQRAVWAVMHTHQIILDDGILGDETIELINKCALFLLPALRSERACYYRNIVDKNPEQKVFLNGWLKRAYGK